MKKEVNKGKCLVTFKKLKGIPYRIRQRKNTLGETGKHIFVFVLLRTRVMEVAYDSIFRGHLGIKNMEDRFRRIVTGKVCIGMLLVFVDLVMCAKTVARGAVSRAPLGEMPLIDRPFERIEIGLVWPITQAGEKRHRFIFTFVDYAMEYLEAAPLNNIDAESVAETFMDVYSGVGVAKEVLRDLGTQFVSECINESRNYRLLSIRRLTTTPHRPI